MGAPLLQSVLDCVAPCKPDCFPMLKLIFLLNGEDACVSREGRYLGSWSDSCSNAVTGVLLLLAVAPKTLPCALTASLEGPCSMVQHP